MRCTARKLGPCSASPCPRIATSIAADGEFPFLSCFVSDRRSDPIRQSESDQDCVINADISIIYFLLDGDATFG